LEQSSQGMRPLRIMTYNIHRWAGMDQQVDVERLAQVIRSTHADVIGLNEVIHPLTGPTGSFEPLRELAQSLNMHFAFGPSGWTDFGPAWGGPQGNALLSKFPLADISNDLLPRMPTTKQRSLLGARLQGSGMHAFVTHLDHALEITRLLQIEGVLSRVGDRAGESPHFIGGDFNAPGFLGRHTRRILPFVLRRMQSAGYRDAFSIAGSGNGRTFPARAPLVRLDFLWLPSRWSHGLRSARTVQYSLAGEASDHRPVVAEWQMPAIAASPYPIRHPGWMGLSVIELARLCSPA
jgi:endonuclease/exonuclease/phosphatase family metal-dependent hydrolase